MNGILSLKTVYDGKKTVTEDLYFTSPFKLYSPFYDEKGRAKYINMCSSAGILKNDENKINLHIGENCQVIFTDQSYQKLFNTQGGISSQNVNIKVSANGSLFYVPHPVMTFAGCCHKGENHVEITSDSLLVFREIYCCGRTAMGEEFALKKFSSRTEISINGKTDFIDNTLIDPSLFPLRQKGFFGSFTHTGFMYIFSPDKCTYKNIYDFCTNKENIAATHTEKGLCIRMAGFSGDEISKEFDRIAEKI